MSLQLAKNAVTSRVMRQVLISKKNSPALMFGIGVAGMIGTTILACRATLKVDDILDNHEKELRHFDARPNRKEEAKLKVQTAVKISRLYAPAVGLGVVSCAALTGSHVVLSRRNAALMAAYSALDKGFNEYRARVREELGEDKELELRHNVQTIEVHDTKKGEVKQLRVPGAPSIYARYFDEYSTSWQRQPEYNMVFLRCQQNYANDKLRSRGHVFLNEVYDSLGLERTKEGAVVGWLLSKNGDNYVDFGMYDDRPSARNFVNGREASILLDFNVDGVIYDKI